MKKLKGFMPGQLSVNAELQGFTYMFSTMLRIAWSYKRTFFYLLKKRGLKAAYNFFYVKTFVPTGEGAGAAAYFLIGPLIRKFPRLAPYPKYIEMEMTTVCNKRCILCEHTYWNEKPVHLTFEQFKQTVDQFPDLKWVNLTGEGDAFLNPDYLNMLEYLKKKDVCIFLVDSFDNINEERARRLLNMDIDGIYVSFDAATKETYEKIKVGCKFERSLGNLKRLIELKKEMNKPIPDICFRFIITTLNYTEMPQFVELVRSLGTPKELGDGVRIEFCGLLEFPEIAKYKVWTVPKEILQETIKKSKETGIAVYFAHSEPEKHPPLENCIAWMEPYVMTGGYMQPCCAVLMSNKRDFLRKYTLGNVYDKSIHDIWYSERYKRFRDTITNPKAKVPLICNGCRAYSTEDRAKKYGVDETL